MKLIDVDKLIVELKNLAKGQILSCPNIAEFFVSIRVDRIIDILNSQPTAFDVEKVVEQLEEHVDEYEKMACECIDDEEEIVDILEFRAMGVRDAIEIVKAGGIDE